MGASNGPDWVRVFILHTELRLFVLWIPLIFSLQSHHVPLIINSPTKKKKKKMLGAPVMRRTTSMSSGMRVDDAQLLSLEEASSDPIKHPIPTARVLAAMDTAHFLRTCGLCKRPLAPGRDIYMYRGDTAFCTAECREKQMRQDQRNEKLKAAANKKEDHHHASQPPATATSTSKPSSKTETMAAA